MHLSHGKNCLILLSGLLVAGQGGWAQTPDPLRTPPLHLGTYGTPGLIDMPTAHSLPDGQVQFTSSYSSAGFRNTLGFQLAPRIYGTFRYAYIRDYDFGGTRSRYDRSFDLHVQLLTENARRPGLALGLRDFGGTGIYAGEYLVATKTLADRLSLTAGLGWGRLASEGGFRSPLCSLADRFCDRPASNAGGLSTTGQLDFGNWFRGDMALFGGMHWQVNDRLSLMAEYSSDAYEPESSRGIFSPEIPVNLGASYRFDNGLSLSGYLLYGTEVGVQLSYGLNPANPPSGAGLEPAAPVTQPRDKVALASWNLPERAPDQPDAEAVLRARLAAAGLRLEGLRLSADSATLALQNLRYGARAQAIGRANRILANTLTPEITRFEIILQENGVAQTRIITQRDDFYALEHDLDGAWRSLARAQISDAAQPLLDSGVFPRFDYRLGPYATLSFFDPDDPLRYDLGVQANASWSLRPGLSLSGQLRQPIIGNLDDASRPSDSVLPRVRSDWQRYAAESNLELNHLVADYRWRPASNWFARVTGGYLEPMFGGLSAEALWYPVDSRIALGVEVNYARQRDFDMLFGFQDYDVITGHGSVYYDLGGNYHAQLDLGRYLAGDWGATFSLDREFNNGFKLGGFFTLTDVSSEEFGEGSFDKGIRLEIPLSWFTGRPSPQRVTQIIRPVLRDGGARLVVPGRLYESTRSQRAPRLSQQWGRYFR